MSPERDDEDDFLEDEEQEEYGQRSIFATGWFRAVLVLLVLAVIAVIAVPLIGGWFEPTPPPKVTTTPSAPPPPLVPVPSTPPPASPPATPPAPPPSPATSPAVPPPVAAPAPAPTPAPTPPAISSPTPAPAPARPEMPAATTPKPAEKPKPPERTAGVTPGKSASAPAAAGGNYWVQVGAFKESGNAEGLAQKLRSEGYSVQVTRVNRDGPLHVVRVGGYPDRSRATAAREELQGKGRTGFVTSGPAK
ncbi:MAG TPA: SPOR domain-containing protein [Methylomirabilota bacterium]|nr:SPOR domain-containing protein [Methylomirabilota bacterium]